MGTLCNKREHYVIIVFPKTYPLISPPTLYRTGKKMVNLNLMIKKLTLDKNECQLILKLIQPGIDECEKMNNYGGNYGENLRNIKAKAEKILSSHKRN